MPDYDAETYETKLAINLRASLQVQPERNTGDFQGQWLTGGASSGEDWGHLKLVIAQMMGYRPIPFVGTLLS